MRETNGLRILVGAIVVLVVLPAVVFVVQALGSVSDIFVR